MMMRTPVLVSVILLHLTCIWGLTGCGGPPGEKRYKVSGKVTLDGQPVALGSISFKLANGAADWGEIKNGSYSLQATPGEKRVEIGAVKASDKDVDGKVGVKESVQLVPEKYNKKSELKETVAEKENTFNFDLKSDK